MANQTITFHTDPDMVVLFAKKWAEHIKKTQTPAEAAIAEDMVKLVELGHQCLVPATEPAEPGKK